MEQQQIDAYKNLAAAVLAQAFDDLKAPARLAALHEEKRGEWKKSAPRNLARRLKAQEEAMRISMHARNSAHSFLFSPSRVQDRSVWLAWLDMDEDGFKKLVNAPTFQGHVNTILA